MQLHELQRQTKNKTKKRVGRGGARGKTSGKGHKGQKARAGGSPRPEIRDIIKSLPKRRGHGKNRARTFNPNVRKPEVINLGVLHKAFTDGDTISPKVLVEKKLVRKYRGRVPMVKILGQGSFERKACTIEGCLVSASAKEKLEKAGNKIASSN